MKPTAIIVEDEELARGRLRDFIELDARIELVGEAVSGHEAIQMIDELGPDLVFLDIEIPGPTGLDVLEAIRASPAVIFTTAFQRFAVAAFELAAIDYLLKPFSPGRLRLALDRALARLAERDGETIADGARGPSEDVPTVQRVRETLDASRPLRRLFVPGRKGIMPLPVEEIRRLEARDDYVAVHDAEQTYLVRTRLKELEKRLDPRDFVRVHRSHILNLNHVDTIQPYDANRLVIEMKDGTQVIASRSRSAKLRQIME